TTLAYSDDGRALVTASQWDPVARVWETETGGMQTSLRGHTAPVLSAEFAPGGRVIATAGREGTVRLWELATGRTLATLQGNDNHPFALVFSPDGQTLAAGGVGQTIWKWDITRIPGT